MKDIQVIISTFNNSPENIDRSFFETNTIIINQLPINYDDSINERKVDNFIWYDVDQKGLSKSRNIGIDFADSTYLYLTDDDVILNPNFSEIVLNNFENNADADVLAFQVNGINRKYKDYSQEIKKIGFLSSQKLSSVQLVFKTKFLKNSNIFYDELFGTGSVYSMGEENILLFDLIKNGANIYYIPEEIGKVYVGDSSWFNGFTNKYFFDRGAIIKRMYGSLAPMYITIFALSKYQLYKKDNSFREAIKQMNKGARDFKLRTQNYQ